MKSVGTFFKTCAVVIMICCLLIAFTGCSIPVNKDRILDNYNKAVQLAGNLGLTKNVSLQGKRIFGTDHYVGTYTADYNHFSKTEYLFGGTSIERKAGKTINVTCNMKISEGTAQLIYVSGSDKPKVLTAAGGKYTAVIELKNGGNYFGVACGNFTGSIELAVNDV